MLTIIWSVKKMTHHEEKKEKAEEKEAKASLFIETITFNYFSHVADVWQFQNREVLSK